MTSVNDNESSEVTVQPEQSAALHDDYATRPVPANKRKRLAVLAIAFAGYFASAFNLFVGGAVGSQLTFVQAVGATLVGGAVVLGVCISIAMIAFKRGLSTTMLARASFGRVGQIGPSLVVIATQPAFAALYTASFGIMINRIWPGVPWWTGSTVFVVLVTATAVYGLRGLAALSAVAVPGVVILIVYGLLEIDPTNLLSAVPSEPASFWLVVSFIFGGWVAGATVAGGDIGRYANSKRDVFIAPVVGYLIGFVFIALASTALALREGSGDIVDILLSLNITLPALLLYLLLIWTTADNILYYVSLALANIEDALVPNPRIGKTGWVLIGAGAILALGIVAQTMGLVTYMQNLVSVIGIAVPPVAGILIADYYIWGRIKLANEVIDAATPPIRPSALVAWAAASAIGLIATISEWGAPGFVALISGVALFPLARKLMPDKNAAHAG